MSTTDSRIEQYMDWLIKSTDIHAVASHGRHGR
jgi:hypothetical protein